MGYIHQAISEILTLLYNSSNTLSPEQQSYLINIVIGLDYDHVPELFMVQNALQGWKQGISFCTEKLMRCVCRRAVMCSACELERIDLNHVTNEGSKEVMELCSCNSLVGVCVVVGLLRGAGDTVPRGVTQREGGVGGGCVSGV